LLSDFQFSRFFSRNMLAILFFVLLFGILVVGVISGLMAGILIRTLVFCIAIFLPGYVILSLFPGFDFLERLVLGFTLSTTIVLFLVYVSFWFDVFSTTLFLVVPLTVCILAIFVNGLFSTKSNFEYSSNSPSKIGWIGIVAFLLLAFLLRFSRLFDDLSNDQINVVMHSLGAIRGDEDALVTYKKPWGEALITIYNLEVIWFVREWSLRLPMLLAGLLLTLIIYMITKELSDNEWLSILSGFAAAICGYLILFSYFLQSQVFTMLFLSSSFYLFITFFETNELLRLYLSGIFAASAMIMHYNGIFFIIPLLYIIQYKVGIKEFLLNKRTRYPSMVFIILSGIFFIPYVFLKQFKTSVYHYSGYRFDYLPHFQFTWFLEAGTFRLSGYFMFFLLFGTIFFIAEKQWTKDLKYRALFAWFLTYFLLFMVWMKYVEDNFYIIFPPWIIVACLGYSRLLNWDPKRVRIKNLKSVACSSLIVSLCLTSYYVYAMYSLDRVDSIVSIGRFYNEEEILTRGLKIQNGLKAAGYWIRTEASNETYWINIKSTVALYYMDGPAILLPPYTDPHYLVLLDRDARPGWEPLTESQQDWGFWLAQKSDLIVVIMIGDWAAIHIFDTTQPDNSLNKVFSASDLSRKFDEKYGNMEDITSILEYW